MAVAVNVLTLFFTAFFLGIHLVTFCMSLWSQLVKRPERGLGVRWLFVAVTLLMGTVGILSAVVDVALNNQVWVTNDGQLYSDLGLWMNIVEVTSICSTFVPG